MDSWEKVQMGFGKIRSASEKVTPPVPSDEFEDLKINLYGAFDRLEAFVNGQVTGEGSMSMPGAEPE